MMKKRPIEFLAGGFVLGELCVMVGVSMVPMVFLIWMVAVGKKFIWMKKTMRGRFLTSLASFCAKNISFRGIRRQFGWPILFCCFFVFGGWRMQEAAKVPDRLLWEEERVTLWGTVAVCQERPDGIRVTIRNGVAKQGERKEQGNWYLYGDNMEHLIPGNVVLAEGVLSYPQEARNTGEFDYRAYCNAMKIAGQVMVENVSVLSEKTSFLDAWFQRIRRIGYTSLAQAYPEDRGMIAAIILGNRNGIEEETYDRFSEAGTAHLLSISALHLSLVGYSLFRILSWLGVWPLLRCMIPVAAVWGYAYFSGSSPSALRAAVMFSIMMGGRFFGRTYDLRTGMAFAAFYLFGKNPLLLTLTGVQYSFAALLGIAFVVPKMQKIIPGKKLGGWWINIGIFFATLPVQCKSSFEFSPISVLVNALIIPSMSLLLVSGIGGLAGAAIHPGIGRILFFPAHGILWGYHLVHRLSEQIPFGKVLTGEPTWIGILLYVIIVAGILHFAERKKNPRLLILLLVTPFFLIKPPVRNLQIHFLDVGQGDCTVIQCPGGRTILIDGGSTSKSNLYEYTLEPFLKANRIGKLDVVAATHMDQDHISALVPLLKGEISTEMLLLPSRKNPDTNAEWLKRQAVRSHEMACGEGLSFGQVRLTCLSPGKNQDFEDENAYSLVFLLEYHDFRCLFTGDLGEEGEQELLKKNLLSRVDLLKVGHHGSRNSSSEEFLQKIRPELAIISCEEDNHYGHPHQETLLRLEEAGSEYLVTAEVGEICVQVDRNGKTSVRRGAGL